MGPWICPRCGTVNASWMPNCNCKEHQQTLAGTHVDQSGMSNSDLLECLICGRVPRTDRVEAESETARLRTRAEEAEANYCGSLVKEENVMLKALLSEVRIADHLMRLGGRSELPAAVLRRLRACAHIKTEVEHG